MSFHVRTTCNDHTGKTEITEVVMGDDSVVFQRRPGTFDVCVLADGLPKALMLTLTPAEARELVMRLTDMLAP
jgi:hypothetical protein